MTGRAQASRGARRRDSHRGGAAGGPRLPAEGGTYWCWRYRTCGWKVSGSKGGCDAGRARALPAPYAAGHDPQLDAALAESAQEFRSPCFEAPAAGREAAAALTWAGWFGRATLRSGRPCSCPSLRSRSGGPAAAGGLDRDPSFFLSAPEMAPRIV